MYLHMYLLTNYLYICIYIYMYIFRQKEICETSSTRLRLDVHY